MSQQKELSDRMKKLQNIRREAWIRWDKGNKAHNYFQNVQRKRWLASNKSRK